MTRGRLPSARGSRTVIVLMSPTRRRSGLVAFVAGILLTSCAPAFADALSTDLRLDLAAAYAGHAAQDAPAPAAPTTESGSARPAWGEQGSFTVNLTAGYADDFEEIGVFPGTLGVSWFVLKNLSVDLQLEAAHVIQPGDDASGAGAAFMVRWHFLDQESWTLYADLGVGFLVLSEPVPQNAADFVFTPRAGVGASVKITEMTRLLAGVRWFHISNAETSFENPGVDTVQGYLGVSFGF
jgi:hypothetical protein